MKIQHSLLMSSLMAAAVAAAFPAWGQDAAPAAAADATTAAAPAAETVAEPAYLAVQRQWEQARYASTPERRVAELEAVAEAARQAAKSHADQPEVLIWEGIVLASLAGEKGGLSALSLCKEARVGLDRAIEIDPSALAGSAYTTLGSLYYQVPGWPIGFGDDDKARELLQKALEINPDGIDSNYFYGDFLREEGEYKAAVAALEHALQAAPRPGRELADQGRRAEIEKALADARRHLRG